MTTLLNAVLVDASPGRVWDILTRLDALQEYDPAIARVTCLPGASSGPGAARQCDLRAGGWFRERVTVWEPHRAVAFELRECTLPVRRLHHHYTLTPEGSGTRVEQRMEYELKHGLLGRALDALFVRRQWDAGIKGFFVGLKRYAESAPAP